MKNDGGEHGFNDIIDNYARYAEEFSITGGDGIERKLYQIEGGQKSYVYKYKTSIYNNTDINVKNQRYDSLEIITKNQYGIFEWIVDPDKGVTHRRFIPNGKITGQANQIPTK